MSSTTNVMTVVGTSLKERGMRPGWNQTWMAVATVISHRSLCTRARIGAVIVDPNDRIVSVGYNGPPAGFDHGHQLCTAWCTRSKNGPTPVSMTSYEDCPSLHAEINALSVCDRVSREGGSMYVTGTVCFTCAKAIANSGITQVVMAADDADYRKPDRSVDFLEECGVRVVVMQLPSS